jgi:formylglycine-generating enzyme required for sulfatase activity
MADIFISYSSNDRDRVIPIVKVLENQDRSVWWDREILPGKRFSDVIEEEISAAKCVIVIWSISSVKSDFVQTEAAEGAERRILVPAMIDKVKIPFEFRRINAADLTDWKGEPSHAGFQQLIKALTDLLGPAEVQVAMHESQKTAPTEPIPNTAPITRTKPSPEKSGIRTVEKKPFIIEKSDHSDIDAMVKVPAGEFIYQNGKAKIEKPYMIDVYPVTNNQFRKFIEAGGYKNLNFWSAEGQKWLKKSKASAPAYWNDEKWNQPEHPVVGVSFYEAEAYAEWSGKRLPTEKEWERAARATDGRKYPWGNEFDPERCNTSESEIGSTTPVTQCPKGISLVGCYDLAGNVWEWCQDWYDESKSEKIFRGGSWNYYQDNAECSNRFKCHSYGRDNDIGFRCVRDLG